MKIEYEADNCFFVDHEFNILPAIAVTLIPDIDAIETVLIETRFLAWRIAIAFSVE